MIEKYNLNPKIIELFLNFNYFKLFQIEFINFLLNIFGEIFLKFIKKNNKSYIDSIIYASKVNYV